MQTYFFNSGGIGLPPAVNVPCIYVTQSINFISINGKKWMKRTIARKWRYYKWRPTTAVCHDTPMCHCKHSCNLALQQYIHHYIQKYKDATYWNLTNTQKFWQNIPANKSIPVSFSVLYSFHARLVLPRTRHSLNISIDRHQRPTCQ